MTAEIAYAAAEKAQVLIDLRRYAEARAVLGAAVAAAPEAPVPWCLLAQACLGADDHPAALDAADRAVALDPGEEWGHRLRSLALERLDRRGESVAAARRAVECDPHVWMTHARLADVLSADVDKNANLVWTEALLAAKKAVELGPHEPQAYEVLAQAHAHRHEWKEMALAEARALELAPDDADLHNNLALLRLKLEQLPAAGAGFARAAALDPRGPGATNFGIVSRGLFDQRIRWAVFTLWWGGGVARFIALDDPSRALRVWAAAAVATIGWFLLRPVVQFVLAVGSRYRRAMRSAVVLNRRLTVQAVALVAAWLLCVASLILPAGLIPWTVGLAIAGYVVACLLTWVDREGARVVDPGAPRR